MNNTSRRSFSKILIVSSISCVLFVTSAVAQTPSGTNAPAPSVLNSIVGGLETFFKDNTNIFNQGVTLEAGALENRSKYGGFVDIQFPVAGQASVGFGTAYLNKQIYTASLTARLGTTWNLIPKVPIYTYLEAGPALNMHDASTPLAQTFTGALIKIPINSKWEATIGAAAGYITGLPGVIIAAGGSITMKF